MSVLLIPDRYPKILMLHEQLKAFPLPSTLFIKKISRRIHSFEHAAERSTRVGHAGAAYRSHLIPINSPADIPIACGCPPAKL